MAFEDGRLRLEHMLRAILAIEEYTSGKSFADYQSEAIIRDAVERNIERLSEASRRVPEAVRQAASEVPWRLVAGIGNILRHDYDGVDDVTIWNLVQHDLGPLRLAVERLLSSLGQP